MDISKYWKTIVDTLQDGVMVVDPGGKVLSVNPAAERLTGYKSEELIGKSCRVLDCTGCEIIGEGKAEKWCGLFVKGKVRAKKCLITNKEKRSVNIIKNATILYDEDKKIIGAVETLTDMSALVTQQFEISQLRRSLHLDEGFHGLIGKSPVMQNLFELIENVALTEAPVIISGPSGTGKELVARAIHEASDRKEKPFVKVNCSALNENLLESELFGHVRGAYSGAEKTRIGRFEAAHGGTIFLDEIGDISPTIQVKLLRTLEEKEIERVGDNQSIKVDVRILSATNKDLEVLVNRNRFRDDLYFRINVFPINCPPLKDHVTDIPILVQHFIRLNNQKSGKKILGMTPEAIEKITAYPWPGNVRELRNAIEYAFVLCSSGGIGVNHLPPKIAGTPLECVESGTEADQPEKKKASAKKAALIEALRQTHGNRSETARLLGVSRVTVWKQIKRFKIDLFKDLAT
ncbi:MAG: sigma 54-interacting transcriptional regulator [Deltaproteobacteria bacterium]|nr:sigma 54-interacting transcriptional regulator [Deltaproteobacteria bacterium]